MSIVLTSPAYSSSSQMIKTRGLCVVALFFLFVSVQVSAQHVGVLPRGIPEEQGVSSAGILSFLDAAAKSKHEFHSFMFLRHGKVIAEGWWKPYRPDLKHTMYSASKSFTSTAVGFAVSEKRLSVDDKVISFFPADLPDSLTPYLAALTVKNLLTMSVGQDPDPTFTIVGADTNWVKAILATPIVHMPGTKFLYNSLATYMLSAIVQKVTGQKVIDYLRPRLFTPLGIRGMDWEVDPRGINTGGWGLRIKTEDMAKFGQLYLQKGHWRGKQILPAAWVTEATSAKIDQAPDAPQSRKDSSEWLQGYCYQFWRCRHNAFRADGAYGQYIIILPEQDAVIAITAESPDMQDEINLVWNSLLPAIRKNRLPANRDTATALTRALSTLALSLPAQGVTPPDAQRISRKTFTINENPRHMRTISLQFTGDTCHLTMNVDTTAYVFAFGSGKWLQGTTTRRGPSLIPAGRSNVTGLPPFEVAGSYHWKDQHTLELFLRYIESPHTETITCQFDQNLVSIILQNSNVPTSKRTELKGVMKE